MTPAALLLDLDGTLVLSERVHRLTWERLFADLGVTVDDAEYRAVYMGRRAGDVLAEQPGPWAGRDLQVLVDGMVAHALTLAGAVDVVAGAGALVRAAHRAGVPVAVVTSAGAAWAGQVLGPVLGVREHVAVLVTAADVAVGKPDPEGYLLACRSLGVDPAGCLGVEDSASGLRALRAAGVGTAVGVTTTTPAPDLAAAGASWTVPDLAHPSLSCARPPLSPA